MGSHGVTLGDTKGVKKGVKLKLIASLHLVIYMTFIHTRGIGGTEKYRQQWVMDSFSQ